MSELPKPYLEFMKRYPDVGSAYEQLADACHDGGPLSLRERALVKLGLSLGGRLEGAVHAQARKALQNGLKPSDLRHAVLLALTTLGFPTMMAGMTWVEDVIQARPKTSGRRKKASAGKGKRANR
jgi:4-carboxymuconolactone decarboxylase